MRGVNSARGPTSLVGGVPVVNCLGVVHMEEKVQDRVQVEVGREEQGTGETHGQEQGEEQRERTNAQSTAYMDDHESEVMLTNTFLSHVSVHHSVCALCRRKMKCEVFLSSLPVGESRSPSAINETNCNKK